LYLALSQEYVLVKEYIKVKNSGLVFHNICFNNLKDLVNWFKKSFKTDEYRRYVKKTRPPCQSTVI